MFYSLSSSSFSYQAEATGTDGGKIQPQSRIGSAYVRRFRFAAPLQRTSVVRNAYRPPLLICSASAGVGIRLCAMRTARHFRFTAPLQGPASDRAQCAIGKKTQQACWKRKTAVCMVAQRHYTDRWQNLPQTVQQDLRAGPRQPSGYHSFVQNSAAVGRSLTFTQGRNNRLATAASRSTAQPLGAA